MSRRQATPPSPIQTALWAEFADIRPGVQPRGEGHVDLILTGLTHDEARKLLEAAQKLGIKTRS